MTDDQSFDAPDPFDDELRRRFAGSAPAGSDPDVVLDAMRPQLARARTRRRASFASAIAGVAVIVVALAFVLGGGGGSSSVHTPPATEGPVRTVPPAPTTAGVGGSAQPPTPCPTTTGTANATPGITAPTARRDGRHRGPGHSTSRARHRGPDLLVSRGLDRRALRQWRRSRLPGALRRTGTPLTCTTTVRPGSKSGSTMARRSGGSGSTS